MGRYTYYKLGATNLATLGREKVIAAKVPPEFALKRPDGLIVVPYSGSVKAYIEYKTPQQLRTKGQISNAVNQELDAARCLCKVLIVTDGQTSYWINTLTGNEIKDERQGDFSPFNAYRILKGEVDREELIDLEDFLDRLDQSLGTDNDTVTSPALLDPSQLAKTIWQKIWINTGKEPEKCLYNVVELFVFKFLSDLGVLRARNSFDSVYRIHKEPSPTADREALDYYATQCRREIHGLFPIGGDGTTIINGTIFVNEVGNANPSQARLFGQVLDDLKDYADVHGSFRYIQREFKTRLYESFLRQGAGIRLLGQYFTPRNVVRAMVEMSPAGQLPLGSRICDPFCGVGGFLLEVIVSTPHIYQEFEPKNGVVNPGITLVGYDKGTDEKEDERTIILAKANMLIYFSELLTRYNSPEHLRAFSENAFNKVFRLIRTNLGTFAQVKDERYDLILTNPPYVTSGSNSLKKAISEEGLSQFYTAGGRGTEALALEWVVRNLKAGGTAMMVVPDGLLNQTAILSYVKRECLVRGIISLPVRTFYSTPKKTYILILERKRRTGDTQTDPVFVYLASEIGETRDAKRWPLEQNDLTEAAAFYNQFKGTPATFGSGDERWKTIPFSEFQLQQHWLADRWWTPEERCNLGVADDPSVISDEEFQEAISDLQAILVRANPISNVEPTRYREVDLDSVIFELHIGRRLLKKDMVSEGIPVYSANVSSVFGYVATSRMADFSRPALLWGIDGGFDWGYIPEGQPFVATDHCGILYVRNGNILPRFLYHELKATKDAYGFDRTYRANLDNIRSSVKVRIPTRSDGSFDLEAQQRISDRYDEVDSVQSRLTEQLKALTGMRYEWQYFTDGSTEREDGDG